MLPLELWLMVFKYTDDRTFKKIMMCIFNYDKDSAVDLYSLVCVDTIKNNVKIVMMNNLLLNPTYYRKKRTYIDFVIDFDNANFNTKGESKIVAAAATYKKFIHQNSHICFDNESDASLFKNLTSRHATVSEFAGVLHTGENCEFLYYYKQKIPICNIVKFLLDNKSNI